MAKIQGIPEEKSNILSILNLLKMNVYSNLNCHNIGKIIDFDKTKQTCTVQLMQVKQFNENYYLPAPITDVPLIIYGAGHGHITLPNPINTYCLLLFMDRNIDNFITTGEQYTPDTTRMHDFTDCVALTTFKTLVNPLEDYDENAVTITYQNSDIKVKDEITINNQGDIRIKSPTRILLDSPYTETTGNFKAGTGFTGLVPCGMAVLMVSDGIIIGVA